MVRTGILLTTVTALLLASGCESTQQQETEFKLSKVERERDSLAQRLRAEQSKALVLERRIESEQVQWNADRAEVARLHSRVRELERAEEQRRSQLAERLNRPVERPQVAASPLPRDIDQALLTWSQRFQDRVSYDRGRAAVSFANDRLFELGSDTVQADANVTLNDLAGILATLPQEYEIVIVGHTDDAPITKPETRAKHPTNWHLSVHRAISVKDMLNKAGVPAKRLGVMGYGSNRPVASDRAKNRRVEIFIIRKGAVQTFEPIKAH
jgi:chemotaxis protein MotB